MKEATVSSLVNEKDAELLRGAEAYVYWEYEGQQLKAYKVPTKPSSEELRPAIIFLHGGLWDLSQPAQFIPHCYHLSNYDAVCFSAEYRVLDSGMQTPLDAVEDARNLVIWVRENAETFGIDPERVILSGAGSGAHAVLNTALRSKAVDKKVKLLSDPDCVVLFSPIVDTTEKGVGHELFDDPKTAASTSPSQNIRVKRPPMMIMHSKADRVVSCEAVSKFVKKLNWWKRPCKLVEVEGQPHAFYNFNFDEELYLSAVGEMTDFLIEEGFLKDKAWNLEGEIVDSLV